MFVNSLFYKLQVKKLCFNKPFLEGNIYAKSAKLFIFCTLFRQFFFSSLELYTFSHVKTFWSWLTTSFLVNGNTVTFSAFICNDIWSLVVNSRFHWQSFLSYFMDCLHSSSRWRFSSSIITGDYCLVIAPTLTKNA